MSEVAAPRCQGDKRQGSVSRGISLLEADEVLKRQLKIAAVFLLTLRFNVLSQKNIITHIRIKRFECLD